MISLFGFERGESILSASCRERLNVLTEKKNRRRAVMLDSRRFSRDDFTAGRHFCALLVSQDCNT
jgi:hypothetical protein